MDILLVARICHEFNIDLCRPVMLQVSRYDYFKDPVGVIRAYRLVKKEFPDVQLVLAGGGADDDPEGQKILEEVYREAGNDEDIHILLLPPDAHMTINALQRAATVVLQKSIREGFGLTVSEALWKRKPVIGGDTGGIKLQIDHEYNGFRVKSYVEAAQHICSLLASVETRCQMGERAYRHVKENFLVTRSLQKWMNFIEEIA
jgi:trehalose synthase